MLASLEQLRQCHFLFMKWMRKTDAHWQQLPTEFDSGLYGIFQPKFLDQNLIILAQVVVTIHQLDHYCSKDIGQKNNSYMYTEFSRKIK